VEPGSKYSDGLQPLVDAIDGKSGKSGPKAKAKVKEDA